MSNPTETTYRIEAIAGVFGFCAVLLSGIAAAVYLAVHGHPFVAVIVLLIAGSVRVKTKRDNDAQPSGEATK